MSRRRLLSPQLILLGGSLLLMALLGEVVLRVVIGPPIIWRNPQEHYAFDPELGHRLEPNQVAFTHDKPFTTNDQGIRAPDTPRTPAAGTRRLLALGDSQTAGDGLLLEDTWPSQLARELGDDTAEQWEVLNAGLSGSSPWQHAILLERLADAYAFEGVVLGLYPNDVTPRPDQVAPAVVTNTLSRRIGYVFKRSALFTAIWRARQPIQGFLSPDPSLHRETRILTGEADPLVERGWHDVEVSLREMRDFSRDRGLSFWILVLPRRDQVAGTEAGRAWNTRTREIADRLGVPLVDALEPLQDEYTRQGQRLFIAWDGHNSAEANRVVAGAVADLIARTSKQKTAIVETERR